MCSLKLAAHLVPGKRSPEEEDVRLGRVHLKVLPSERLRDAQPSPLLLFQNAQQTRVVLRKVSGMSAVSRGHRPSCQCCRRNWPGEVVAQRCLRRARLGCDELCAARVRCALLGNQFAQTNSRHTSSSRQSAGDLGVSSRRSAHPGPPQFRSTLTAWGSASASAWAE